MQNFKINENDSGQRLNKFIEKCYFNVPKSLIYKAIRTKNIKVNKKRTIASYILKIDCLQYLIERFKEADRYFLQSETWAKNANDTELLTVIKEKRESYEYYIK